MNWFRVESPRVLRRSRVGSLRSSNKRAGRGGGRIAGGQDDTLFAKWKQNFLFKNNEFVHAPYRFTVELSYKHTPPLSDFSLPTVEPATRREKDTLAVKPLGLIKVSKRQRNAIKHRVISKPLKLSPTR